MFPMKFWGIVPNNVLGILNIGISSECSMNILQMLHAFFLGGLRNTIVVGKAVPDIYCVSLKIKYFHGSVLIKATTLTILCY